MRPATISSRPSRDQPRNVARDFRRDAVAVHVPPRPTRDAGSAAAPHRRGSATATGCAASGCRWRRASRPRRRACEASATAPAIRLGTCSRSTGAGSKSAWAARDQAAPRQRDDLAAIAGRVERQHQVDHGQAGARRAAHRRRSPRDPRPPRGHRRPTGWRCSGGRRRGRRAVPPAPGCRPRARRLRASISRRHRRARSASSPSTRCASTADACDDARPPARDGLIEDLAEIAAEQPPLREAARLAALRLEPLREMVRLARPGAHAFGADVRGDARARSSNKRRRARPVRCRRSAPIRCRGAQAAPRGSCPKHRLRQSRPGRPGQIS